MSDSYGVMRDAVARKLQVVCVYNGLLREVCPHVIGTKKGRPKVLSFQFEGESSKGLPPGGEWRCMFVDEIERAESRPGEWHTGGLHTQPQTCVDEIDVEVAY